jgi:hypothetical protein
MNVIADERRWKTTKNVKCQQIFNFLLKQRPLTVDLEKQKGGNGKCGKKSSHT